MRIYRKGEGSMKSKEGLVPRLWDDATVTAEHGPRRTGEKNGAGWRGKTRGRRVRIMSVREDDKRGETAEVPGKCWRYAC